MKKKQVKMNHCRKANVNNEKERKKNEPMKERKCEEWKRNIEKWTNKEK